MIYGCFKNSSSLETIGMDDEGFKASRKMANQERLLLVEF